MKNHSELNWRDRVKKDYAGILSNEQIVSTIAYWEGIIADAQREVLEDVETWIGTLDFGNKDYERGVTDSMKRIRAYLARYATGGSE